MWVLFLVLLFVVTPALVGGVGFAGWLMIEAEVGSKRWTPTNIGLSETRGDAIAAALQRYRESKGAYPAQLNALTPDWLPSLPEPTAGRPKWRYSVRPDGQTFVLGFEANRDGYPSAWFDSAHPELGWKIDN